MKQNQEKNNQPMSVLIMTTCPSSTVVQITIFDKQFHQKLNGKDHRNQAIAFVNEWNEHLGQQWSEIKETSATMMQCFIVALKKANVDQNSINTALKELATLEDIAALKELAALEELKANDR